MGSVVMVYFGVISFILASVGGLMLRAGDMGGVLLLLPLFLCVLWNLGGVIIEDIRHISQSDGDLL